MIASSLARTISLVPRALLIVLLTLVAPRSFAWDCADLNDPVVVSVISGAMLNALEAECQMGGGGAGSGGSSDTIISTTASCPPASAAAGVDRCANDPNASVGLTRSIQTESSIVVTPGSGANLCAGWIDTIAAPDLSGTASTSDGGASFVQRGDLGPSFLIGEEDAGAMSLSLLKFSEGRLRSSYYATR